MHISIRHASKHHHHRPKKDDGAPRVLPSGELPEPGEEEKEEEFSFLEGFFSFFSSRSSNSSSVRDFDDCAITTHECAVNWMVPILSLLVRFFSLFFLSLSCLSFEEKRTDFY